MELSEQQNTELSNIKNDILKFTPQVFTGVERGAYIKPVPDATSILLELGGQYFVVTAGHVLESKENLGFALDKKFHPLHNDLFLCYYDADSRSINNKYDIGIVKLENDTVAALKNTGFKFLAYENISFTISHSSDNWYLLVGYPANSIKYDLQAKSFGCRSFSLLTHELVDKHVKFNVSNDHHLIMKYERRSAIRTDTGQSIIGHKIKGVSGSGVWCRDSNHTKLVGIFTEYDENSALLMATRIHVIVEILRQRFLIDLPKTEDENLETMIRESFTD